MIHAVNPMHLHMAMNRKDFPINSAPSKGPIPEPIGDQLCRNCPVLFCALSSVRLLLILRMAKKSIRVPLYRQLYETLRKQITNGVYKSGDILPSEHELYLTHNATQPTARQALALLVNDGYIKKTRAREALYRHSRRAWVFYPLKEDWPIQIIMKRICLQKLLVVRALYHGRRI